MEQDLNNLKQTISKLPQADKSNLLTFLLYETSAIPEKDRETIKFLIASNERFQKWIEETDKVIKETDIFLNEIKKSA